jgi:hypothetical protein
MTIIVLHALQMIIELLTEIAVCVQQGILMTGATNLAKHAIFHVQHVPEIFQIIASHVLILTIEYSVIIDVVVKMDFMRTMSANVLNAMINAKLVMMGLRQIA